MLYQILAYISLIGAGFLAAFLTCASSNPKIKNGTLSAENGRANLSRDLKNEKIFDPVYLLFSDSNTTKTSDTRARIRTNDPYNFEHTVNEKGIYEVTPVRFNDSRMTFSPNVTYDPNISFRIYMPPSGEIKGVLLDVYAGGQDRFDYPAFVDFGIPEDRGRAKVIRTRNIFRKLLEQGYAIINARMSDVRINIGNLLDRRDIAKPFLESTLYRDRAGKLRYGVGLKHQARFTGEIDIIKWEIAALMDGLGSMSFKNLASVPKAARDQFEKLKSAPRFFTGVSFGGVIGLYLAQDPLFDSLFDGYLLVRTPSFEEDEIPKNEPSAYAELVKLTYLQKPVLFLQGELDKRIGSGHVEAFLKKLRTQSKKKLVDFYFFKNLPHQYPDDFEQNTAMVNAKIKFMEEVVSGKKDFSKDVEENKFFWRGRFPGR